MRLLVLAAVCLIGGALRAADRPGVPLLFDSGRRVPWTDYRGSVLVLDFFAPYCLPCAGVSRELHKGIALHYQTQGGNAQGLPVRLLTINIDDTDPAGAERFRTEAGIDKVFNDPGGALFESYGGRAVPLIVVLDATRDDSTGPGRVMARWEGNPGLRNLRAVIDRIDGRGVAPAWPGASGWRGWGTYTEWRSEASGEALASSDYQLYQAGLTWTQDGGACEMRMQTTVNWYELDYAPAPSDLISHPTDLSENEPAFQGRLRARVADRWQAELSGGWYEGFADYRSVWLDEYYRQYFGKVRGYQEADPGGWNLAPGVRWECLPGTTWLQAGLVIQQDEVSPGYEKAPFKPLVRGTDQLDTLAGSIGLEHVLSRRVRTQQSLRFTDTTDRDLRYEYQLSFRWAAADRWTVRGTGGATLEPPDFYAYQGQVALERDWQSRWFVGLFTRYYTDNGLVRDPKIVSNASPPLDTWQVGLTLRHQSPRWAAQVSAGPYWTLYDDVPPISRHFSTLYADRDWLWVQAAVNFRF